MLAFLVAVLSGLGGFLAQSVVLLGVAILALVVWIFSAANSASLRSRYWKQLEGKWKAKWGLLTDDDLKTIKGRRELLVGKIQERYGIAEDEARRQVDEFYASLTPSEALEAPASPPPTVPPTTKPVEPPASVISYAAQAAPASPPPTVPPTTDEPVEPLPIPGRVKAVVLGLVALVVIGSLVLRWLS